MTALFQALESPVMTDLDALFPEGALSEIWPAPLPDLYYGEPVVLTARLDTPGGIMVVEGQLAESTWRETLSLAEASPANGVATIWARNRIAGIEESRYQGMSHDMIDRAVLRTALDFHLVSRLTSLVAVDVTPARDVTDPIIARTTPNMAPDGWDLRGILDEDTPTHHASLDPDMLSRLQAGEPRRAEAEETDGLPLPGTATQAQLMMMLGLLAMLLAGLALVRTRRLA